MSASIAYKPKAPKQSRTKNKALTGSETADAATIDMANTTTPAATDAQVGMLVAPYASEFESPATAVGTKRTASSAGLPVPVAHRSRGPRGVVTPSTRAAGAACNLLPATAATAAPASADNLDQPASATRKGSSLAQTTELAPVAFPTFTASGKEVCYVHDTILVLNQINKGYGVRDFFGFAPNHLAMRLSLRFLILGLHIYNDLKKPYQRWSTARPVCLDDGAVLIIPNNEPTLS